MEKPKLTTITDTYIAYNGDKFRIGDIVHYTMECGGYRKDGTGCFKHIDGLGILTFDCSEKYKSIKDSFNICNLKSISRVELKGTEE
jgi:hypothetical protein